MARTKLWPTCATRTISMSTAASPAVVVIRLSRTSQSDLGQLASVGLRSHGRADRRYCGRGGNAAGNAARAETAADQFRRLHLAARVRRWLSSVCWSARQRAADA